MSTHRSNRKRIALQLLHFPLLLKNINVTKISNMQRNLSTRQLPPPKGRLLDQTVNGKRDTVIVGYRGVSF